MIYEEDNGLSIADRTISLQYRQFRSSRKESKQLINITAVIPRLKLSYCLLDNKKIYLLSEAEIQKYEKYLNRNLNRNILNCMEEQLMLTEVNRDEIYVDIEGFSIEIAKKLGNNYLGNNFILVSTKQIECDSIRDSHLGKYIRKIYNTHRNIIEQILMGEALIGIVRQKDISLMTDNPESLFNIDIVFDTPNNAISKLKNIRKDERILLENDDKLKDRVFLKNLLQSIEDVSIEHGSLDRIPDKEINLKEKVDFNKLHLNAINDKMSSIDIYCLRYTDGVMIFVYFSTDSTLSFNDEKENYMKGDLIILNGKDIESINVLMKLGMVGYNPYIGLERAANMILGNRKDNRENINGVEQHNNRFDLYRDENIPERAKELLDTIGLLIENKRDKDFFINLGQIKIYMTYPLIQNEILYELLTRMENDEYK